MNAVLEEKYIDVQEISREKYEDIPHSEVVEGIRALMEKHRDSLTALVNHSDAAKICEEYEDADFDEVMKISNRFIEQHKEALTALANAERIEYGRKYIHSVDESPL